MLRPPAKHFGPIGTGLGMLSGYKGGRVDLLLPVTDDEPPGQLHLTHVPAKRQRLKESTFDLAQLEFTGVTTRGTRLAPKPVSRLKRIRG